ncbi:hypothetical protein BC830DRAFT_1175275 [Chytriomyces sp. MP71]|nr:hypothetical protein BC830DRAFT_1175275 [Chytriomyces sp. MP71]
MTPVSPADINLSPGEEFQIRIYGSTFQGSGADGTVYYFMVRKDKSGDEWKIEKRYSDFLHLDMKLRSKLPKSIASTIGKLPDKSLFTSVNPMKSDQRKIGLEMYLQRVIDAVPESKDMVDFVTNSVCLATSSSSGNLHREDSGDIDGLIGSSLDVAVLKEGFLMKRGNTFGLWKPKYFKCKPYFLDFSDGVEFWSFYILGFLNVQLKQPQRDIISTISLKHCHVVSVRSMPGDTKTAHGILLTEFHKEFYPVALDAPLEDRKISHRHVLAADNDIERDEWVSIIQGQIQEARGMVGITETLRSPTMAHIRGGDINSLMASPSASSPRGSRSHVNLSTVSSPLGAPGSLHNSVPALNASQYQARPSAAGMVKNAVDDNARAMQQKPKPFPRIVAPGTTVAGTPASLPAVGAPKIAVGNAAVKGLMQMRHAFVKKRSDTVSRIQDPARIIFGAPLDHAVTISRISEDLLLPAVVYRCIEYLDHVKACNEEGIYRLSGSANAIQTLKGMFNLDGDLDLCTMTSTDWFDVHAVSGLLKLYLRELPTPVLTAHLQKEFHAIVDLDDRNDRVLELARLVSLLPKTNYTLLQVLVSHLLGIVQACDVNKMSVRNVGIVFAPTLGVPALVFILLLAEFDIAFCWEEEERAIEMRVKISEMMGRRNIGTTIDPEGEVEGNKENNEREKEVGKESLR